MSQIKQDFSESWNLLPSINIGGLGSILNAARNLHPVTKSISSQLSQDLLNSIDIKGSADSIARQKRLFSKDGWKSILCNAIFSAILYRESYLLLDFGDKDLASDPSGIPKPLRVINSKPVPSDYEEDGTYDVNEARFIKFDSPYSFPFSIDLESELLRYDCLTDGIIAMVAGQGIIKAGIENLYQILSSSSTDKLFARLNQLKQANKGDGVLAYDMNREEIEIIPKIMGREVDSIKLIENRISAMTGLPSFIIWGHTDGDGYGVNSALHLYNQRIQSLSEMFIIPVINYILELLNFDDLYAETKDIFVESPAEQTDRFTKLINGLATLQDIGAITSIEARDTVMSNSTYLVLNPNTPTISPPITSDLPLTDGGVNV